MGYTSAASKSDGRLGCVLIGEFHGYGNLYRLKEVEL